MFPDGVCKSKTANKYFTHTIHRLLERATQVFDAVPCFHGNYMLVSLTVNNKNVVKRSTNLPDSVLWQR